MKHLLNKVMRVLTFGLVYVFVVPVFSAMFWWSMKVKGIEPKTGQKLYKHDPAKQTATYIVRRRKGYWYTLFGKDEYIKRPPSTYGDMDYVSFYPSLYFSQQ